MSDPLWYKDAVIYQTHIKAFFDSNQDGIGDFAGMIEKLDYIRDLGVTAIWLLPFYPSPLRDDGYDIQDYRRINPAYGEMADVKHLIKAAHARGLRLITELVINHTSDQHPWFQRARHAKPGSKWRDYYVWSDTNQRYTDTRIIFVDTEVSNWTWDPVANAWYWHRFYSHQPDLNFDNPQVLDEVIAVMKFWFRLGVDGLRLDAVPYLIEREGTNCENLPETHDVLRRIRAEVDAHFPDRLLLAEANQWPEDTRPYFGDGDECHMAFHFPLMPRMYLGLAREDRHPITDIMRQTPEIPPNCQWAIFLRNHDELTLEMVTQSERDYLWDTYAADRRMRINLGIRRRLAPLMGNDRRKIELMNSMLLSMPGTPVLYYGDEIGMGDNVYLGDRDGVRTPMQWSPDRNGGFSRANPQQTYLPAIMDPMYGYQAVNVEAQLSNPASLLNWMRRLIGVRNGFNAFGRGALRFLYPGNRKVLAYLREYEAQTLLCVVNLSRHAQAVELDLAEFNGRIPVELLGRHAFPPLGDLPYLLTLPGHGFYWFELAVEASAPDWHQTLPLIVADSPTLVVRGGWKGVLDEAARRDLEQLALPAFLPAQRWFPHKDERLARATISRSATLGSGAQQCLLAEVSVKLGNDGAAAYWLPMSRLDEAHAAALPPGLPVLPFMMARLRTGPRVSSLVDATVDPAFAHVLLKALREAPAIAGHAAEGAGPLRFEATNALAELDVDATPEVRRVTSEQSNTSFIVGNKAIFKLYRRSREGVNPETEIARFLTARTGFRHAPALLGTLHWQETGKQPIIIAAAYAFWGNQGDGWQYLLDGLQRDLERLALAEPVPVPVSEATVSEPPTDDLASYTAFARVLGQRTGELHAALASANDDPDFAPEPIRRRDLERWRDEALKRCRDAMTALRRARAHLPEAAQEAAEKLIDAREAIEIRLRELPALTVTAARTRVHGDFHLGQVLVIPDDCILLDFEGEPARDLAARRAKRSPLQDVAGMLRSFDYLVQSVARRLADTTTTSETRASELLTGWHDTACRTFVRAWRQAAAGSPGVPSDGNQAAALLRHFLLDKVLYEISYEASNRPQWIDMPMTGLSGLMADSRTLREYFDD